MASFIPLSSESSNPSESLVAKRLMDWVNVAFQYYAHKDHTATVSQTMQKLADYLATITNELRATNLTKKAITGETTETKISDERAEQHFSEQQPVSDKVNEHPFVKNISNDSEVKNKAKSPNKEGEASALKSANANTEPVAFDEQCRICLEPVAGRRFAMLEQCDHKYCESCLRSWIRENPNQSVKCPTCRVLSSRVIIRDNFLSTGAEKSAEFDSMLCCAPHVPENDEHDHDETVDDNDFVIIPQYQEENVSDSDDEHGTHLHVEIESEESQEDNDGHLDIPQFEIELDYNNHDELDYEPVSEDEFEESVANVDDYLGDYQMIVVTDTDDSNEATSASEQSDSSWLDSNYEDATSDEDI